MVSLKFTHKLIEIEGVPDNLRIAVGETFTLAVLGGPAERQYDWFANNDAVLTEVPGLSMPGNGTITFSASTVGTSTVQLQYTEAGKNVPTIERAYKVTVTSKEAVSARFDTKGQETLGGEQG